MTPKGHLTRSGQNISSSWIVDASNYYSEIEGEANNASTVLQGNSLYAGYLDLHWGHFLVTSLSRLWYLYYNPHVKIDKIVYVIKNPSETWNGLTGNIKEFFRILGLLDKLVFIKETTGFEKIIIPDLSWGYLTHYSEEFNVVFDKLTSTIANSNHTNRQYPKKIYFTRSHLEKAQLAEIGMDMLDSFFLTNGYEVFAPEKLSLTEMVLLIQNADILAGASGSTVHNIIFGKRHQKLIIIDRDCMANGFQPGLNLVKQIDCTYIDGSLAINQINSGLGPFFYYPTRHLIQFAIENQHQLPDNIFLEKKWLTVHLKKYISVWQKFYKYQWYIQGENFPQIDSFYEAYLESFEIAGKYLKGEVPLFLKDRLSPTRIIKQHIRNAHLSAILRHTRNIIYRILNK